MIPKRIYIYGDSIAWGEYDQEACGWADRLKVFFRNHSGKYNQVYNLAISGVNTKSYIDRINIEITARKTSSERVYIAVIALSVNDAAFMKSLDSHQVKFDEYRSVIENLANKLSLIVDKIVFIGTIKADDSLKQGKPWNSDYLLNRSDLEKYNKIAEDFCKENDYLFIKLFDLLSENDLSDGLHPNSQGHKKIFEKVKEELIEAGIIE